VRIFAVRALARTLLLAAAAGIVFCAPAQGQNAAAPDLQAAFLLNFIKFVEWPNRPSSQSIVICISGDDRLSLALKDASAVQPADRQIEVIRMTGSRPVRDCHVLFIAAAELRRDRTVLNATKGSPVLTVSDGSGFAEAGGVIGLFAEGGRMKFAVNIDSANDARLRLSSRLLSLAKIVRGEHAP
jgi:hypothetical protein